MVEVAVEKQHRWRHLREDLLQMSAHRAVGSRWRRRALAVSSDDEWKRLFLQRLEPGGPWPKLRDPKL